MKPLHSPVAQRGQSMTEYVVICATLVMALGIGMVDDNSALWQLVHNFQVGYQRFSFALSLPG